MANHTTQAERDQVQARAAELYRENGNTQAPAVQALSLIHI